MSDGKCQPKLQSRTASDKDAKVKEGMKVASAEQPATFWRTSTRVTRTQQPSAATTSTIPIFIPSPTRFVPAGKVPSHDYVTILPISDRNQDAIIILGLKPFEILIPTRLAVGKYWCLPLKIVKNLFPESSATPRGHWLDQIWGAKTVVSPPSVIFK